MFHARGWGFVLLVNLCCAISAVAGVSNLKILVQTNASDFLTAETREEVRLHISTDDGTEIFTAQTPVPGSIEFKAPAHQKLTISVGADQWWSLPAIVPPIPEGENTEVLIDVIPATVLQGIVQQPPKTPLPEKLMVAFFPENPENMSTPRLIRENCELGEARHKFRCVVPAKTGDFRLNAPSFVSRFYWNQKLPPGGTKKLGHLRLQPGGSLVGRVATWDGSPLPKDCAISVFPEGLDMQPGPKGRYSMITRAEIMPHNYFQFGALEAGTYALRVSGGSFAPAELHNIEILKGREANLMEALSLNPPVVVDVVVDPPTAAGGNPWRVILGSASDHRDIPVVQTDAGGVASIRDLHYGQYLVQVEDTQENGVWAEFRTFETPTVFLPISLELIAVEGVLMLGEAPLEASLVFGGRFGALSARLKSNENGEFFGSLPHDGRWEVDIEAADGSFAMAAVVDVPHPKNGTSELEIALPDTKLEGIVVTEEGYAPAGKTEVTVRPLSSGQTLTVRETDEEGRFLFRGLPEGPLRMSARSLWEEEGESEEEQLALTDGSSVEKRLILHPKRHIKGVITAQGRPLPGARILVETVGDIMDRGGHGLSDATGNWECSVSQGSTRLNVRVFPPGWGALAFLHQIRNGQTEEEFISIDVGQQSGTLLVHYPPDSDDGMTRHYVHLRHRNGTLYDFSLKGWARAHDSSIPFPSKKGILITGPLEVGVYDVCRIEAGSPDWAHFVLDPYWLPCRRIEVTPYGETEISLASD